MVYSKQELGELIKKARINKTESIGRKYTQEMLANDVGVSRSYIGDYESGRRYPKYDVLAKIAEACGVHLSFFGEETDVIYYDNPNIFNRLPEDLQEFIAAEKNKPYLMVAKQLEAYDLSKLTETEMKFLIDWLKMAIKQ